MRGDIWTNTVIECRSKPTVPESTLHWHIFSINCQPTVETAYPVDIYGFILLIGCLVTWNSSFYFTNKIAAMCGSKAKQVVPRPTKMRPCQ